MTGEGYDTRQKRRVADALRAFGARAVTADELYEALKQRGEAVGKTTVYRQLERMASSGEARKALSLEGQAIYQYVGDASACDRHLHCQCLSCGRLLHVDCAQLDQIKAHLLEAHGFLLDAERTVWVGACEKCREG